MFLKAVLGKSLREWSDEELVQAFARKGRHYYFDELFNRYHENIYGYCLSRTAEREASKDLTLLTFEQAFTQLRKTPPQRFLAWLFGLAAHTCSLYIREQAYEQDALILWQEWQEPSFLPNEALRRLIEAQQLNEYEAFRAAIRQLPTAQQTCVQLFHLEGLSYSETATRTGYTLAQVKSYLQNGRRMLRRKLGA